ncbi:hypothetical protein GCM10022254_68540 [Actinomadura meridiana]|uniref:Uncharacterized protein n=1 Tax=Actinomadura meridiana TaxID=559626 RepID=A0ABP8CN12_9ACTN
MILTLAIIALALLTGFAAWMLILFVGTAITNAGYMGRHR